MKNPFTKLAAIIFGIIALVHLCRLVTHFTVNINHTEIPYWLSVPGVIIAGALSVGLWREGKR